LSGDIVTLESGVMTQDLFALATGEKKAVSSAEFIAAIATGSRSAGRRKGPRRAPGPLRLDRCVIPPVTPDDAALVGVVPHE
jgi:hypothetical protein